MDQNLTEAAERALLPTGGTLQRWLTGPRVDGLPHLAALPAPALSFEFFPPKNDALEAQLWTCIRRLEPLAPRFVSVTYGAGGTTQARTHATVARLVRETSLTPAAHLTCVGASRGEVDDVARSYWDAGVRHIVALLGDPPADAHAAFTAAQRAALDTAGTPRPVLEWGLRHLERSAPPPGDAVLNHNDFRTGNYMVEGNRIAAVLDWEFAAWGDPHADLGWLCAPCWRFGAMARDAGGVGSRDAFYGAYTAASGRAVDHARVLWWELAATVRWAVVAADQAGRHLAGDTSLELALTGHIVPELEMDVLRMTGVA